VNAYFAFTASRAIKAPAEETEPPLTEPEIINCAFVTGCKVEADDHTVRIISWSFHPSRWNNDGERRIVSYLAMPMPVARALKAELNRKLKAGH
jgi:hypothetical protein